MKPKLCLDSGVLEEGPKPSYIQGISCFLWSGAFNKQVPFFSH